MIHEAGRERSDFIKRTGFLKQSLQIQTCIRKSSMQYYKANEITATNRRFAEPQNDTVCCEAALNTQTVT